MHLRQVNKWKDRNIVLKIYLSLMQKSQILSPKEKHSFFLPLIVTQMLGNLAHVYPEYYLALTIILTIAHRTLSGK